MTITTTKSWKNYMSLCRTLERNDIRYNREDEKLCVMCRVGGNEIELSFRITINPSKMLITLYSPLPIELCNENAADMALAVCMINSTIEDGLFCMDIKNNLLYFKMTSSFYETQINDTIFEYMLSASADIVDEYYPKLKMLARNDEMFAEN